MRLGTRAPEPVGEPRLDDVVDDLLDGGRAEFLLGLAAELGFGELDLEGGDESFLDVLLRGTVLVRLGQLGQLAGVFEEDVVDCTGEGPFESGHVRTALVGGDGVDEGLERGVESLDPAHRHVDGALAFDVAHLSVDGHPFGEGLDAGERDHLGRPVALGEVVDEVGEPAARHELEWLPAAP